MRALILSAILFATPALADNSYSVDVSKSNELYSTKLGVRNEGLFGGVLNFTYGLEIAQKDYSNYLVYDRQGNESSLSQKGIELVGGIGAEVLLPTVVLFGNANYMITSSPLAYYGYTIGGEFSPNQNITVLGYQHSYLNHKAPQSWVSLPDTFESVKLPTDVNAHEDRIKIVQAINESLKLGLDVMTVQKKEERPRSYGVSLKIAIALTDSLFLKQVTTRYWDGGEPLMNDRGYFKLDQADIELGYEPFYNMLISAACSFQLENENDPRTDKWKTVASNGYGFGARYDIGSWETRGNVTVFGPDNESKRVGVSLGITRHL